MGFFDDLGKLAAGIADSVSNIVPAANFSNPQLPYNDIQKRSAGIANSVSNLIPAANFSNPQTQDQINDLSLYQVYSPGIGNYGVYQTYSPDLGNASDLELYQTYSPDTGSRLSKIRDKDADYWGIPTDTGVIDIFPEGFWDLNPYEQQLMVDPYTQQLVHQTLSPEQADNQKRYIGDYTYDSRRDPRSEGYIPEMDRQGEQFDEAWIQTNGEDPDKLLHRENFDPRDYFNIWNAANGGKYESYGDFVLHGSADDWWDIYTSNIDDSNNWARQAGGTDDFLANREVFDDWYNQQKNENRVSDLYLPDTSYNPTEIFGGNLDVANELTNEWIDKGYIDLANYGYNTEREGYADDAKKAFARMNLINNLAYREGTMDADELNRAAEAAGLNAQFGYGDGYTQYDYDDSNIDWQNAMTFNVADYLTPEEIQLNTANLSALMSDPATAKTFLAKYPNLYRQYGYVGNDYQGAMDYYGMNDEDIMKLAAGKTGYGARNKS